MQPVTNAWRIVAVREINTKLRDKTFIASTLLTLVIIAASIIVPAFFAKDSQKAKIAVLDDRAASIVQSIEETPALALTSSRYDTRTDAEKALQEEEADALLAATGQGWEIIYSTDNKPQITEALTQAVTTYITTENAAAQGIDLTALAAGTQVNTQVLNSNDKTFLAFIVGIIFAMLFYMASLIFGQVIAMSVVEEKQNRIVEIIATAIPTSQLLAGKIIGNFVLALGQILLYSIVGLASANALGKLNDTGWILASTGWFIAFYMVGFAAIATMWAAIGSMASRTEDIGSLSTPLTLLLMVVLFAGIYVKGALATVLSFVPIFSSIIMPMRLMREDVASWEPLLALGLGLIATYFFTKMGARIYTNNIMRSGSAVTWKQALKK